MIDTSNPFIQDTTRASSYSETDLLHFNPLSAHAYSIIQHSRATLSQTRPQEGELGRTITILNYTLGLSHFITLPLAAIECVAFSTLALLGGTIHCLTGKQSAVLEKYSTKSLASAINSFTTLCFQIYAGINFLQLPEYHTPITLLENGAYLGSAALAHFLTTAFFHSTEEATEQQRSLNALIEGIPDALQKLIQALLIDARPYFYTHVELSEFYEQMSEEQQTLLQNFEIQRVNETGYLNQYIPLLTQFLEETNLTTDTVDLVHNPNEVVINSYSQEVTEYQRHLTEYVKKAIQNMVANQWTKYLNRENSAEEGKDLLECFDAGVTQPIANIAQLMEVMDEENSCPIHFQNDQLSPYNNPSRHAQIATAKSQWDAFNNEEKELMIQRLIKGSDFEMGEDTVRDEGEWNAFYLLVTELSSHLHQGHLMSVLTFNLEDRDFSSENLFGKAWGKAVEELDSTASS